MAVLFCQLFFSLFVQSLLADIKISNRGTFEIDFDANTFKKDGKPFRYISGSFHYSRVPNYYWEDRLIKMRAAGINAVQTYVTWNTHEPSPGQFNWKGDSDLTKFLELSQKAGLVVLLRLGPYACGEWEFGGFPAWLLNQNDSMVLRSSDPTYMKWVTKWFQVLLPKIKPYLYNNGGPVAMVQVENEYGSYFACDHNYVKLLRDLVLSTLGESTVIYSTDGDGDGYLRCGKIKGVYATVDFGLTYDPVSAFNIQRKYEPKGPLVNSEFYLGWLDHWGSPHSTGDAVKLAFSLDKLLNYSANINMYMFVGGTNFGYYNGANYPFAPVPTSYDYDAPISEAGDITLKFYAMRDIISKYLRLPPGPIPQNTTKAKYGGVTMNFMGTVQDNLHLLTPEGPYKSRYPVNIEKIKFYYGFALYRFKLTSSYVKPTTLQVKGLRDRAMVMIDKVPFGIIDRTGPTNIKITGSAGQVVDLLVENQGRINYGTDILYNTKGITENVTLAGKVVTDWELYPLHLENIKKATLQQRRNSKPRKSSNGKLRTPAFYVGQLHVEGEPQDTFLDPTGWGKGQAMVNDFNLGRYWPNRGPQVTLFVPKPFLQSAPSQNFIYMFEVENSPCNEYKSSKKHELFSSCQVQFTDISFIDGPNDPGLSNLPSFPSKYSDPNLHLVH